MKYIDLNSWKRKAHYDLFKNIDYPHFNISAYIDISRIFSLIKKQNLSFFQTILFAVSYSANSIKELRYRIKEDKVVEYSKVNPSFTVLNKDDSFIFCTVEYSDDFNEFIINASKQMAYALASEKIEQKFSRDDILYITSIPWISFTGITHSIHMHPVDSIPRISWGKYFETNEKIQLPLSIQVHHALVDAFHIGKFFDNLQRLMNNPSFITDSR